MSSAHLLPQPVKGVLSVSTELLHTPLTADLNLGRSSWILDLFRQKGKQ